VSHDEQHFRSTDAVRDVLVRLAGILALTVISLSAQSFDFVSVRQYSLHSGGAAYGTDVIDLYRPDAISRVEYRHMSLKTILMAAYGVGKDQIAGPSWLSSEHYDIVAQLPSGLLPDQIPAMLQSLLIERFRMTVHQETVPRKGFALLAGKTGPELVATQPGSTPGLYRGSGYLRFTNCTVTELARLLSAFMGRTIVDQTGIQGNYDITLKVYEIELKMAGLVGDTSMAAVTDALRDLGLKLESRTVPATNVVIDKADRIPALD
jgi:uncharacterized protein (TIGR03435 family)